MSRIVVVMMVKNEEHIIERALKSVEDLADKVVIVDTGSVDSTKLIAALTLQGAQIPFRIYDADFVDFSHNRNLLLEYAKKETEEYVLMLDADETIDLDMSDWPDCRFKSKLFADIYNIQIVSGQTSYRLPRLTKNKSTCHYEGVTHEYMVTPHATFDFDAFKIVQLNDSSRRREGRKFEEDLVLLKSSDLTNPRHVFYLAQTYQALGDIPNAIDMYTRRAQMGGWIDEAFYSYYQLGNLYIKQGDTEKAFGAYLLAWRISNHTRIEPLAAIIRNTPKPANGLFIEENMYGKK